MLNLFRSLLLISLLFSSPAFSKVVVLVHGYLGNPQSWMETGIIETIQKRGYLLEGIFNYSAKGVRLSSTGIKANNPVYSVSLPSMASIDLQAGWLAAYLRDIVKYHPKDDITLVGHSAGGVVARLTLIKHKPKNITHLITIASPHLGTAKAYEALSATDESGLLGGLRGWLVQQKTGRQVYNTLRFSRGVLVDLTPPRPGNLLYWLNQQPHPVMAYTSIIRTGTFQMPGDKVVPPFSQDMRNIPALGKRAFSYIMASGHMLSPQDGNLLANLLDMDGKNPPLSKNHENLDRKHYGGENARF